uniref:Uncharacterized protein n=1 Tax=Aegilops tauschii subsp. strangulata TaxID=200361 RepID=A0A453MNU2_AEGTS
SGVEFKHGQTVFHCLFYGDACVVRKQYDCRYVLASFCSSEVGFLWYNWKFLKYDVEAHCFYAVEE